ncbi:hypothetical protein ACFX13_037561 [Malus domestica]
MLRNEVTRHWVHPTADKCREDQVSKRFPAVKVDHGTVKGYLNERVEELPITRGFRFEKHRPKGIEEELKENQYGFRDHISHHMACLRCPYQFRLLPGSDGSQGDIFER